MTARVLIARDSQRAAGLVDLLRAYDVTTICLPATQIEYLPDSGGLPDLSDFAWIAFTSVNAVSAFSRCLSQSDQRLPDDVKLAAVGKTTASAIAGQLREPDLIASATYGANLAGDLAKNCRSSQHEQILWPCAETTTGGFATHLRDSGIGIHPWVCYRTIPVPKDMLCSQLENVAPWDVALFAAPSAVAAFAEAWPMPWPFPVVAIGTITASALRAAGARDLTISDGTNDVDLCHAILSALTKTNRLSDPANTAKRL